jgi:2-iminobutanoate/2-iminopropanoate deaminase
VFALGEIKKQLEAAGSSMEKVLRCTVFLADIKDLTAFNEVYVGKFGDDPPTRSTIAAAIPANSLVEIDVIAYI